MRRSDVFPETRGTGAGTKRCSVWLSAAAVLLTLALGACGTGSGDGGGGTTPTITVSVNPPAVQVQLNQTLQLSATVSGAPNLTIAASPTGAVRANNVVTITTTAAHGFVPGNIVTVSGVADTTFIGTFSIASAPSATTFTFNQTANNATSGGGTVPHTAVRWQVNNTDGGAPATGTISTTGLYTAPPAIPPAVTATITATGAARALGTVTITTTAAHTFTVGQIISITGVTAPAAVTATITAAGAVRASNTVTITTSAAHTYLAGQLVTIAGVTDASFNGTFPITSVPSATTFTYLQTAANVSSGSGTTSATPGGFDGTFVIATVPNTTSLTYTQNAANATSGNGTVSSAAVQVKAISVADATVSGTSSVVLDSGITLTISPTFANVAPNNTVLFTATNAGPTSTTINFLVNDVAGGSAANGAIAPAACAAGAPANSSCGLYTAPAAVPAPATVSVKAQAAADLTKTIIAAVTISATAAPTFTALYPTIVAQGSGFQDFYLTGTNFLTTTEVRINGVVVNVPATPVSTTLLRLRVPESFFAVAGTVPVLISDQGGANPSAAINLTIAPQRPALIGTAPDSVAAGTPTTTARFNGGYYSPSVSAEFGGNARAAVVASSSQLDVTLGAGDLANPGLFPVGVRSPGSAQPVASVNLAVQPTAAPSVIATVATGGAAPSAVAVNANTVAGLALALVTNRTSGTISRIDLATNALVGAPIVVGGAATSAPTGVGVDYIRNVAVVACNGTDNISVVDLATGAVVTNIPSPLSLGSGSALKPAAVAVNSVTGLAVVANTNTNQATVINLVTDPARGLVANTVLGVAVIAGTGANPEVSVDPRLNWAVLTPGGGGSTSVIDLGRQSAITASGAVRSGNVVTITLGAAASILPGEQVTISGVADASFNRRVTVATVPTATTFTYQQPGADATSGGGSVFHPGQLASITLGVNVRGVSVNGETHRALMVDQTAGNAIIFSLLDQTVTNPTTATGSGFTAAAVNPLTNVGVVVNPNGTLLRVDLGAPNTLGITVAVGTTPRAVAIDPGRNVAVVANEGSNDVTIVDLGGLGSRPHIVQSSPLVTLSTAGGITLNVIGSNLAGGTVRLDGTPLATTVVSAQHLTATVPPGLTAAARRFAVDVQVGGAVSNVSELTVIQAVAVGTLPSAVAIDPERDVAVVTNSGSNTISIVNLNTGAVSAPIAVGTNPQGVALIPRLNRAVVTNFGSNNASLVDLAAGTVSSTVTVGSGPLGVAINPDDAQAIVANSNSNTVSIFAADTGGTVATSTVQTRPVAIAIDPVRRLAAVAHTTQNSVSFLNLPGGSPAGGSVSVSLPTGVTHDAETDRFIVTSALLNNIIRIDPVTFFGLATRVGINPTSLAYNRHSSTLVTINTASGTMSVMDFRGLRVREVLSMMGSPLFSVEIHPRTNLAVVVDQANNRVLLVPLPR